MNRITFSTSNCNKETISIPQDDDDLKNRQYTLPIYIGKERALFLFQSLYMAAYVDIFMMVALGMIPFTAFPVMLTIFPIGKNIRKFKSARTRRIPFLYYPKFPPIKCSHDFSYCSRNFSILIIAFTVTTHSV